MLHQLSFSNAFLQQKNVISDGALLQLVKLVILQPFYEGKFHFEPLICHWRRPKTVTKEALLWNI